MFRFAQKLEANAVAFVGRLGAKTVVVERRFGIFDLSERRRLPGQPVCVRFLLEGGPVGLSRLSGYMQFAEKEWWISIA